MSVIKPFGENEKTKTIEAARVRLELITSLLSKTLVQYPLDLIKLVRSYSVSVFEGKPVGEWDSHDDPDEDDGCDAIVPVQSCNGNLNSSHSPAFMVWTSCKLFFIDQKGLINLISSRSRAPVNYGTNVVRHCRWIDDTPGQDIALTIVTRDSIFCFECSLIDKVVTRSNTWPSQTEFAMNVFVIGDRLFYSRRTGFDLHSIDLRNGRKFQYQCGDLQVAPLIANQRLFCYDASIDTYYISGHTKSAVYSLSPFLRQLEERKQKQPWKEEVNLCDVDEGMRDWNIKEIIARDDLLFLLMKSTTSGDNPAIWCFGRSNKFELESKWQINVAPHDFILPKMFWVDDSTWGTLVLTVRKVRETRHQDCSCATFPNHPFGFDGMLEQLESHCMDVVLQFFR